MGANGLMPCDRRLIPFTRLDPARSRNQGGSGLGLPIEQAIARRHQTVIQVHSKPGSGSCFSVEIQAADAGDHQR